MKGKLQMLNGKESHKLPDRLEIGNVAHIYLVKKMKQEKLIQEYTTAIKQRDCPVCGGTLVIGSVSENEDKIYWRCQNSCKLCQTILCDYADETDLNGENVKEYSSYVKNESLALF